MIQRIQSIYLLLSAVCSLGLTQFLVLWGHQSDGVIYVFSLFKSEELYLKIIPYLFIFSGALSLITIFLFKNRRRQISLNRLNIIINFLLIGLVLYYLLTLSGENIISEKGIGVVLPLVSVALLALANKAIKKDDDLVKSVDRLR
ncbi:MAG: hypothetical protein CSA39_00510 [Flavobacteriales bacterium]|nr:MAG: hypothetical protein CR989_01660 [Flavobacteriales bacterium]PIE49832.1 MAG: hypothetical protein CSA39_00510 [Flavobacteriales bacterium]